MDLDSLTQKSHTLIVIDEDQVIGWYELINERGARRAIRLCFFAFLGIANDETYPFKKPSIPALSQLAKTEKIRGLIRLRLFYPVIFRIYPDIPPALLGYYYKRVTFYKRVMS